MKRLLSLILVLMMILPVFGMINVSAQGIDAEIEGARLNMGENLTFDFYASFEQDAEDMSMRFYPESGATVIVQGEYDEEYDAYRFPYYLVNPQCMTESIKAELLYKGEVVDVLEDYSVKKYCTSLVSDGADYLGLTNIQFLALKRLMADMLVFGNEAQKYTGNKTDSPADISKWVVASKGKFEINSGVRQIVGNTNKDNRIMSVSLELSNVVRLCFKIKMYDASAYVTFNGREYQRNELIDNNDGTYYLYSDEISAADFDKVYNVKMFLGGDAVSEVKYNASGYIQAKYTDENLSDIVKALSVYGTSAKKYQKALENDLDDDFDLDDDIEEDTGNLIPAVNSDFTSATGIASTSWTKMGNTVTLSIGNDNGNKYLLVKKTPNQANTTYHAPMLNIAPYITKGGIYEISFRYKLKGSAPIGHSIYGIIRTNSETSFSKANGTNYYFGLSGSGTTKDDVWYTFSEYLFVEDEDIGKGGVWNLGLHQIVDSVSEICIDDVVIEEANTIGETDPISVNYAETWVANEVLLIADGEYDDPFYTVDVDLLLTNGTVTYTIPAFWDGNSSWRARFACPEEGKWTYTTVCSNERDEGLHGVTNTLTCVKYSGDLDIYKHGFVTTKPNTRYFMYADGTPFFYLGDTHWNLGKEPLEITQAVVDKRVEQGFTVWQSEPLGASFKFEDGISAVDIEGLRQYDAKMQYIAQKGLVHANASHFFPSAINGFILNHGGYSNTVLETVDHRVVPTIEDESGNKVADTANAYTQSVALYDLSAEAKLQLEKICRYWVARYSAYPVMWTLGQEVDNDFYWEKPGSASDSTFNGHEKWGYVNNPYKYVAEYINKHDPYKSPLTGHQEYASASATTPLAGGVLASSSAFRDVEAHTWYGAQWSPSLTGGSNYKVASDFWNNSQGKPVVNYEGRYCYLWTKNFGARAQGWMAYLNGMFGYGYGAQDTWCYLSEYSESVDSNDGVDKITSEDKKNATWEDSMEYESAYQVGYMRSFFENTVGDWWNLIPRFDNDSTYFRRETYAYATVASNSDNTKIVAYFSNFSDASLAETPNSPSGGTRTGTFKRLTPNAKYNYLWFNPVTGKIASTGTFNANSSGEWFAGSKLTSDMVLYIYK